MESSWPVHGGCGLLLALACGESTSEPTPPFLLESGNLLSRGGGATATQEAFVVTEKKNGKTKRYRVKLDRVSKTVHIETMNISTEWSQPVDSCAMDSTCTSPAVPCTLDDPYCKRGYVLDAITGDDSVHIPTDEPAVDLAEGEYGPYFCPAYVDDPHFEWRGHHFRIDGRVFKQHDLPYTSGIPKARYLLPPGPWTSDDEKARIWSGTIDGTCFIRQHRILGFRVTEGWMTWYGFRGDGQELTHGSEGRPGTTWVSYGGGGGGAYIDAEAAEVLAEFLETGTCTEGWVIIVDGVREC